MSTNTGEFTKKIIESINELFTDQVGPIAAILAEEAFDEWQAQLGGNLRISCLKNIKTYINLLAKHIDNAADQQAFFDAVYSNDMIKHYSESNNEDAL